MKPRPLDVIVDSDPGIDDACALLAALASPGLKVRGIIAGGGNVPARQTLVNVRRVLAVSQPDEMPLVAAGLDPPGQGLDATYVHGPDGLAQAPGREADVSVLEVGHLVERALGATDGPLALLALAPLTTVRWMLDGLPDFRARLGQVVIMGGAVTVPGNVTSVAEFNFWRDPEAAASVLRSELALRLVPLDVTSRWEVTEKDIDTHLDGRTDRQRFLRHLLDHLTRSHRKLGHPSALLHDAVALAALLRPELFLWRDLQLEVETHGILTRGMVVTERRPNVTPRPNVSVALDVDLAELDDFLWGLLR